MILEPGQQVWAFINWNKSFAPATVVEFLNEHPEGSGRYWYELTLEDGSTRCLHWPKEIQTEEEHAAWLLVQ